jgi:hypothetical protein
MRSTLLLSLITAGCSAGYTYANDAAVPDMTMMKAPDLSATNPADCDLVSQDCKVAPNTKCTIVIGDPTTSTPDVHQCVAPAGTVGVGQMCTRNNFGDDNCVTGTVCTLRGVATGQFFCRKWCHSDTDCDAGQQCSGRVSTTFPMDGMCMPTCAQFGSSCGAGETCAELSIGVGSTMQNIKLAYLCRSTGIGQQGDSCMQDSDCAADSLCVGSGMTGTCALLCDNGAHMCPVSANPDGGLACNSFIGTASTCQ